MSALTKAEEKYESAKKQVAAFKAEAAIQGVAVAGTVTEVVVAGIMGMAEEYWGQGAVMGADIPLLVGVPAAAAALFGVGGDPNEVTNALLRSTGNACLAITAYKKGGQLAAEWGSRSLAAGG